VFATKEVDIQLITKIAEYREFHQQDWQSVQDSVAGDIRAFEYYFDNVLRQTRKIKILGDKKHAT
jgi:hypothetical protein